MTDTRAARRRGLGDVIVAQAARPHGALAGAMAKLMNASNKLLNGEAIRSLQPSSGEHVVDVGFGGGVGIAALLAVPGVHVTGVDISEEMVARARRRFSAQMRDGRVELLLGDIESLPVPDGSADAILTVNTVYFWQDVQAALNEFHRVLVPGGRLVVGFESGDSVKRLFVRRGFRAPLPAELDAPLVASGLGRITVADRPASKVWSGRKNLIHVVRAIRD